jgi:hypothetical protein
MPHQWHFYHKKAQEATSSLTRNTKDCVLIIQKQILISQMRALMELSAERVGGFS